MKPQMTFEAGEEKLHLPSSPQQMSHLRQPRIVLVVLTFLSLYGLFQLQGRKSHALSTSSSSLSKVAPVCSPEQWSKGEWTVKDEKHRSESSSVMEISGFKGCASTFVPSWHLGVGSPDNEMLMGSYRRRASNYVWKSTDPSCDKVGGACPYALIQNLITRGGWLLIGDSISEEHFFSLSCFLFDHVRAEPKLPRFNAPMKDRLAPQYLYLNPYSSLMKTLVFPPGFDIDTTPLIGFRRADLLFSAEEMTAIHTSIPPYDPEHPSPASSVFGTVADLDSHTAITDYLADFASPDSRYRLLLVSTGGHWTQQTFALRGGMPEILYLFENAMQKWLEVAARMIEKNRRSQSIMVRSFLAGHENCHDAAGPVKEPITLLQNIYNWTSIDRFNQIFSKLVKGFRNPSIKFLAIDMPGKLRPDAHYILDCLHFSVGTGVVEGWTDYVVHALSSM